MTDFPALFPKPDHWRQGTGKNSAFNDLHGTVMIAAVPDYDRPRSQDNSGDHAGSDAKPGVGTRCSLRPEISTVNSEGPPFPPGSRKNITTRPFGAKVGPSL